MLWKKEKKVQRLMEDYMNETLTCLETFQECLFALFEDSTSAQAAELVSKVNASETRADKLRGSAHYHG